MIGAPGPGAPAADWRAADADREHVVGLLQQHHLSGRLSLAELGQRVAAAYAATTLGELGWLTADLPPLPEPEVGAGWSSVTRGWRRSPGPSAGLAYAGVLVRAGAFALDVLVVGVVLGAVSIAGLHGQPIAWAAEALWPLYFLVGWSLGRTLGMLPFGLRVARVEDGGRPGPGRAVRRLGGWLVAAACCGLGFCWAGLDPRRQGWHDKVAATVVVEPRRPRALGRPSGAG